MVTLLAAVLALVSVLMIACFAEGAGALSLADLRGARAHVAGKLAALVTGEDGKARAELTEEESVEQVKLLAEFDGLDAKIKIEEGKREKVEANAQLLTRLKAASQPAPSTLGLTNDGVERGVVGSVRERSEDDPNRGYKTPRAFIMDILASRGGAPMSDLLKPLVVKATAGSDEQGLYSDPYGNFAVPPGFSPDLLKTTAEGDVLGRFVRSIPMTSAVIQLLARVDKTHTSSVSGGFRWYWGSEADTVASSRTELEKITLTAHTAKGIAYATNELLADSPLSFAALISDGFAEEYASFISEARLTGTGVGQLLGIRNSGCIIEIDKEDGQVAATVVIQNLLKMLARCWGSGSAVWVANKTLIPQLGVLVIDNGVSSVPIFLPRAQEGLSDMLLGRPILYSEHAKPLGTAGDISLYNMGEYLEGTLQNLRGQTSIHVRFLQNTSTFMFTARKAGAPWWRDVLTPKNGDTLSPYVQLGART